MLVWLTDFHALLIAALLPLAGFLALTFFGRRMGRGGALAGPVATVISLLSLGFAVVALVLWVAQPGFNQLNYVEAFTYHWFHLPIEPGESAISVEGAAVTVGWMIDSLTIALFILVTLLSALVHLFAMGSLAEEPRKPRFFALLGLLNFAALGLILANSLIQMLFFWELIGIAAYFLCIFDDQQADRVRPVQRSALRMFVINALGDAALLAGLGILVLHTQSLSGLAFFDEQGNSILSAAIRNASEFRSSEFLFFTGDGFLEMHWLTWAGICFLLAVFARMAQFPFQGWIHGASEAPLPATAMLQGGITLVAGIYLLARLFPILTIDSRFIMAIVGCVTLLAAALIAIVQTDLRRVLAWSSVSQGGFMLLFLGAGGYAAGVLHLFTHALFKTALFLAAGSVLHGLGHTDLRQMGGLWKRFPITAVASLLAVLALAGAPWLSGAYSSNLGLACVYDYARALQGESDRKYEMLLFWIPALTTYLTAFGIGRWWWLIFAGANRNPKLAEKAQESPFLTTPLIILAGAYVGLWFDLFVIPFINKSIPTLLAPPAGPSLVIKGSVAAYAVVLRDTGWAFLGLGVAAGVYMNGLALAGRIHRLPGINILDYWLRERMFFDVLYEGILLNAVKLLSDVTRGLDAIILALVKLSAWIFSLAVMVIATIERPLPTAPAPAPPAEP